MLKKFSKARGWGCSVKGGFMKEVTLEQKLELGKRGGRKEGSTPKRMGAHPGVGDKGHQATQGSLLAREGGGGA